MQLKSRRPEIGNSSASSPGFSNEVQKDYGLVLDQITPQTQVDSLILAVAHTEFSQMTPGELRGFVHFGRQACDR